MPKCCCCVLEKRYSSGNEWRRLPPDAEGAVPSEGSEPSSLSPRWISSSMSPLLDSAKYRVGKQRERVCVCMYIYICVCVRERERYLSEKEEGEESDD